MMLLSFYPSEWAKIMDPLTDEYNKLKVGNIKNETIENAIALSKTFAVKTTLNVVILWLISLLRLL
jgi:hypothetical protein